MFLKRFYNSLRYYIAAITQLLIPMIFILLALILVKIPNPNIGDDPRRELHLDNSALSNNVTAFWAEFGSTSILNFAVRMYSTFIVRCTPESLSPPQNVTPTSIHATSFRNYTDQALSIKNGVKTHSDIDECCNYKFQLLDKFCASRTIVSTLWKPKICILCIRINPVSQDEFNNCTGHSNFGYRECTQCLR